MKRGEKDCVVGSVLNCCFVPSGEPPVHPRIQPKQFKPAHAVVQETAVCDEHCHAQIYCTVCVV